MPRTTNSNGRRRDRAGWCSPAGTCRRPSTRVLGGESRPMMAPRDLRGTRRVLVRLYLVLRGTSRGSPRHSTAKLAKKFFRRSSVDAAEPVRDGDAPHAGHRRDARLVGERDRERQAHRVARDEPLAARALVAVVEAPRAPSAARRTGRCTAPCRAPCSTCGSSSAAGASRCTGRYFIVVPTTVRELPPPRPRTARVKTPFSRWRWTCARAAARGSCVTITMVFLKSRLSVSSRPRISSALLRVEVAGRLVGDEHRRIGDDRARDRDALLLAARELPRVVLRAIRQADDLERGHRALAALASSTGCVSSSGSSTFSTAVSTGIRL